MGKKRDGLFRLGVIGLVGIGLYTLIKSHSEEEKRKNTPCVFDDILTSELFEKIAIEEAKPIKRLWVDVYGAVIKGTVRSESGCSQWYFTLDFNDYGKVTGKYWLTSDNDDSLIPKTLATKISERINLL